MNVHHITVVVRYKGLRALLGRSTYSVVIVSDISVEKAHAVAIAEFRNDRGVRSVRVVDSRIVPVGNISWSRCE